MKAEGNPIKQKEPFEKELFLNVFNLPEFEIKSLKERIKTSNGAIRIFVHPFFEEIKNWHTPPQRERILAIQEVIKRILDLNPNRTPPLFIAQEVGSMAELEEKLGQDACEKIYIIPTFPSSPQPRLPNDTGKMESADVYASPNWKILTGQLKELGVKKILIGGMFLSVAVRNIMTKNGELSKRLELDNCVGTTATILSRDFEVEISNLAYPHGRKEYQASQKEVK